MGMIRWGGWGLALVIGCGGARAGRAPDESATRLLAQVPSPLTSVAASPAGPIQQRLFQVHTTTTVHAYVLLDGTAPAGVRLSPIAPSGGYEYTLAADAGALPTPRTFTLVSKRTTCVLSSGRAAWVTDKGQVRRAVHLTTDSCEEQSFHGFAIEGRVDAMIAAPEDREATDAELAWIRKVTGEVPEPSPHPKEAPARVTTLTLSGMTQLTTTLPSRSKVVLLRRGDELVATWVRMWVQAEVRMASTTSLIVYDGDYSVKEL